MNQAIVVWSSKIVIFIKVLASITKFYLFFPHIDIKSMFAIGDTIAPYHRAPHGHLISTKSLDKHVLALGIMRRNFKEEGKAYKFFKIQTSIQGGKNDFTWQAYTCSWYHLEKFQARRQGLQAFQSPNFFYMGLQNNFTSQACAYSWYHVKKFQVENKAYKFLKVQTSLWSCKNSFIWQACACSWYHAKKFQAEDKAYKLFKGQTSTWHCKNDFITKLHN